MSNNNSKIFLEKIKSKIKILKQIEKKDIKESLKWSILELIQNLKNTIIYAPNATSKTTLSNIISGIASHFHTKYVEYIDDDKTPHIVLLNKAKKFSYRDYNSHKIIINSSKEIKSLNNFLKQSIEWYRESAELMGFKFLNSINIKLIKEAKIKFKDSELGSLKWEIYQNENYDLKPYIYVSRYLSSNEEFKNKIKLINPPINSKMQGNGKYIENLLISSKNKETKNAIYSLILLACECEKQILELLELELGVILSEKSTSININNLNQNILINITKRLKMTKIIDENIELSLKDGKIIFLNKKTNLTRNVFQKLSEGQLNLMAFIFFSEIAINMEKIIILDDPFDTLDNQNSYEIIRMIKKWEKKKIIIVLTHKISSLEIMKHYTSNNWNVQYLKNKICISTKELENFERKLFYTYKNGNYKKGILLIFRYLKNDDRINSFIYN